MALQYYDGEHVTGSTNDTTFGSDIKSTETEPKTIKEIMFSVSAHNDDAEVIIKDDREEIAVIPANLLPVQDDSGGTNTFQTGSQMLVFEINHELQPGDIFKIGIKNGGTQVDLTYCYRYELRT